MIIPKTWSCIFILNIKYFLTENGTWAYDNSSSSEELVLQFSEQIPFDEINDDWDIVSVTNSQIELSDISGGDGDVELLTFIKL